MCVVSFCMVGLTRQQWIAFLHGIVWYCVVLWCIVQYHRFDRTAVDSFLTRSNNTHVRDCLDPTVIKTMMMMTMTTMMMMMIMMMMTNHDKQLS